MACACKEKGGLVDCHLWLLISWWFCKTSIFCQYSVVWISLMDIYMWYLNFLKGFWISLAEILLFCQLHLSFKRPDYQSFGLHALHSYYGHCHLLSSIFHAVRYFHKPLMGWVAVLHLLVEEWTITKLNEWGVRWSYFVPSLVLGVCASPYSTAVHWMTPQVTKVREEC